MVSHVIFSKEDRQRLQLTAADPDLQGGSQGQDVTQGNKGSQCQGGKDLQEVANPATASTPNDDWVFPSLTVTPGLRASCLTSQAQPDVARSVFLTFNGNVTSSQHELTTALSACRSEGGAARARANHSERLMSSLGTSRRQQSKEEPFPCLVLGDLKAILKTTAKITWNMV